MSVNANWALNHRNAYFQTTVMMSNCEVMDEVMEQGDLIYLTFRKVWGLVMRIVRDTVDVNFVIAFSHD